MARHLGVIEEICSREPTTDTYSLSQSQEEFYFALPHKTLDLVLWGKDHGVPSGEVGKVLGFTEQQVQRVYEDIDQRRRTTVYLHAPLLLLEPVPELKPFALTQG